MLNNAGITGWIYNHPLKQYRFDFAFPEGVDCHVVMRPPADIVSDLAAQRVKWRRQPTNYLGYAQEEVGGNEKICVKHIGDYFVH